MFVAGWSDASDGSRSGSETGSGSESDSSRGSRHSNSSQGRASAVRLAALSCLQTLIKADSRALHPHWPVLLPVYSPLRTKYHPATLMDAIVRDPVPKVSPNPTTTGLRSVASDAASQIIDRTGQCQLLRRQPMTCINRCHPTVFGA